MKVNIFILSVLTILFLASCAPQQNVASAPKVYVVDESNLQAEVIDTSKLEKPSTFVVVEENGFVWLEEESEKRQSLNKIRALRDFEEDEEEFYYESKLSNVRRIIDDEVVRGYIPELDNPDFKEVEEERIVDLSNMEKLTLLRENFENFKSAYTDSIPHLPFSVTRDLVLRAYDNPTSENLRNARGALETTVFIYQFYKNGENADAQKLTREMLEKFYSP